MGMKKVQSSKVKSQNFNSKLQDNPVVNQEKSTNLKGIFGMFSQFVAIGGDFV